jgi:hypothetical protein
MSKAARRFLTIAADPSENPAVAAARHSACLGGASASSKTEMPCGIPENGQDLLEEAIAA